MPIIKVEMLEGRSREKKAELVEALSRELQRVCGGSLDAIYVVIDEVKKENWGVGGKLLSEKYPD